MTPLYDGRENHYKNMLVLQEKLRKSEEERIRLEERFNLLVQESRNRHQACINRLRISYAEFLEEQRARDERNNKLLGTLDKVDSSLALMTAKTERLNVLRKQYEAYLLRAYGAQRYNGSVAADSGLESQHEQDISQSPIRSKSILGSRKSTFSTSHDFSPAIYKTSSTNIRKAPMEHFQAETVVQEKSSPVLESIKLNVCEKPIKNVYENLFDSIKLSPYKPPDVYRDRDLNGYPATSSPMLTESPNEILKTSAYLPMNLDTCLKLNSTLTCDSPKKEVELQTTTMKLPGLRPLTNFALDSYLGKVRRMHNNWLERHEVKDAKPNPDVELSADEVELEQNTSGDLLNVSMSEDGFESSAEEEARERSRARSARFRQAFAAQSLSSRSKLPDLSEKAQEIRLSGRSFDSGDTVDKFSPGHIDLGKFSRSQEPVDEMFAKLAELSEPRRLIQQNRALLMAEEVEVPLEAPHQDLNDPMLRESSVDDEGDVDGDGIEDDYDDTVDIDSWMPDDSEKRQEEPLPEMESHARLRRKLESIEEVEQTEDEEPADEVKEVSLSEGLEVIAATPVVHLADEIATVGSYPELSRQSSVNESERGSVRSHYDQVQVAEQFQFPGFESYSNCEFQQDEASDESKEFDESKDYPDISLPGLETTAEKTQPKRSDENLPQMTLVEEELENSPVSRVHVMDDASQVAVEERSNSSLEKSAERLPGEHEERANLSESASSHQSNTPEKSSTGPKGPKAASAKDAKKKKDPIKSILDSDSESFIERNLSNTESDFDFN